MKRLQRPSLKVLTHSSPFEITLSQISRTTFILFSSHKNQYIPQSYPALPIKVTNQLYTILGFISSSPLQPTSNLSFFSYLHQSRKVHESPLYPFYLKLALFLLRPQPISNEFSFIIFTEVTMM